MLQKLLRLLLLISGGIIVLAWLNRRRRNDYPPAENLIIQPETPFVAIREPDGRVALRWRANGTVDELRHGTQRDQISQHLDIEPNTNGVMLDDLDDTQRHFFTIRFDDGSEWTTGERVIPTENIVNLRDIGGYPAQDGRFTRWNRVYRSGTLTDATPNDLQRLEKLGVQVICDLRSLAEIEEAPDQIPQHAQYMHLPVISTREDTTLNRLQQMARSAFNPASIIGILPDVYTRVLIDQNGDLFKTIFMRIANEEDLPLIVHCAAGKDRTGVTIALLLSLLGVPEDIIIADYSLSNAYARSFRNLSQSVIRRLAFFGIRETDLEPLFIADPDYMKQTLDYIREKYGSINAYLRQEVQLDDATIEKLKANLLE